MRFDFLMLILRAVLYCVCAFFVEYQSIIIILFLLLLFKTKKNKFFPFFCAANLCIVILDQTVYHRHILVFQSSFNRLYARVVTPLSLYQQTKNELSLLLFLQLVWPMVIKFICFAAIDDRPR